MITSHADVAPGARTPFIVLGGVPGAGKSTALARVATLLHQTRLLDSDTERRFFRDAAPGVPYPVLRPLVHLTHQARVWWVLLRGSGEYASVVVHDPSTRWLRLAVMGRLAKARGWDPQILFVDVSRHQALVGQSVRGRVVTPLSFERHWTRWRVLRGLLTGEGAQGLLCWAFALKPWATCRLVSRTEAAAAVRQLAATRPSALVQHVEARDPGAPVGDRPGADVSVDEGVTVIL